VLHFAATGVFLFVKRAPEHEQDIAPFGGAKMILDKEVLWALVGIGIVGGLVSFAAALNRPAPPTSVAA
jgi:hypothetical protein